MLETLRKRLIPTDEALRAYGDASAAVALLLRERDGLEVLAIERAKRETDPWSGHWSLPGGRRQKEDASILDTVHRETEEEVGLSPRTSEILGCIPARAPANRPELLVLPFVFHWKGADEVRLSPEVASVAWVPVLRLPESRTTMSIPFRGKDVPMPAFVRAPWGIWGFTYRLLEDLLALLQ